MVLDITTDNEIIAVLYIITVGSLDFQCFQLYINVLKEFS